MEWEIIAITFADKGLRNKDFTRDHKYDHDLSMTSKSWPLWEEVSTQAAVPEIPLPSNTQQPSAGPALWVPYFKANTDSDLQESFVNDQWLRKLAPKEKWTPWFWLLEQRQD